MYRCCALLALFALSQAFAPALAAADGGEGARRWSADLLDSVVGPSVPPPAVAPVSGSPSEPRGVILKTYQLRTVRVGASGRSQTLLQTMERLLPPGSSLRTDVPANSLHILTTPDAHAALWDFISAVDAPQESDATRAATAARDNQLKGALERLAASTQRTDQLTAAVENLRRELSRPPIPPPSGGAGSRLGWIGGLSLAALLVILLSLSLMRIRARRRISDLPPPAPIVPADQLALALAPAQQRLQQELMGVLNAAAIRMESWYTEQAAQRTALESSIAGAGARLLAENQALLERAEARFETSAARIEANVHQLAVQNDRVEALAGELEHTVRELDSTKDQLVRLQGDLDDKGRALDATRSALSQREQELTRQQAKLAALTLILEEGGPLAAPDSTGGVTRENPPSGSRSPLSPCTIPQTPDRTPRTTAAYSFRFLPPDHPET